MHVAAHDQGFVAASPPRVYGVLADVESYPAWWPSARGDRPALRLAGGTLTMRAGDHRPDVGLILHLGGPFAGTLEWYLEPEMDGTIVNSILNLDLPGGRRRSERRLLRARVAIHEGLVRLKGRLE